MQRIPLATTGFTRRKVVSRVLAGGLLLAAGTPGDVEARGPGLITALNRTTLYSDPNTDSSPLVSIEAGEEGFLTGSASFVFVQAEFRGTTGWVLAQDVTTNGVYPIRLASAVVTAPILDAPDWDGGELGVIPTGGVAMLTGAEVGKFVAASFNGIGGWVDESLLGLPYDADGTQE